VSPLLLGGPLQRLRESAGYFISTFIDALGLLHQGLAPLERTLQFSEELPHFLWREWRVRH
jgi:hypothetical protein